MESRNKKKTNNPISGEANIYEKIYTDNYYYSGENSFFYKVSGGYKDLAPYFNGIARWFKPYVVGPKILDVGCAFGYFLARFKGMSKLYGIDVSEFAIEKAKQVLPEGEFHRLTLPIDPLPWADNTFKTVISTDVIEHLTYEDQPAAVREALRVLEPGVNG